MRQGCSDLNLLYPWGEEFLQALLASVPWSLAMPLGYRPTTQGKPFHNSYSGQTAFSARGGVVKMMFINLLLIDSICFQDSLCKSERERLMEKQKHAPVWKLRKSPPVDWYLPLEEDKTKRWDPCCIICCGTWTGPCNGIPNINAPRTL